MYRTSLIRASVVSMVTVLIFAAVAFASDADTAVADVTAPTNQVTLSPGGSATIKIKVTVSGRQDNSATFEVYKDWSLSGGVWTGSNAQSQVTPVRASGPSAPPAYVYEFDGSVSVSPTQECSATAFNLAIGVTVTATTAPAALAARNASNYDVFVTGCTPTPPSDTTPPVITPNITGTLGSSGWYVSNIGLTWTVTEAESPGSLNKTGCVDQSITADQVMTSYSCSASSTGGSASPVSVLIGRDTTDPTISGSASPAPNGAGWNNTSVVVSYTCGDATSGVSSCGPNETLSGDGASLSSTGTAVDNAGNSASDTVSGINIDKTAPVVNVTGVSNGSTYTLGSVPTAGCSTTDALSGVATAASLSSSGGPVGSITATCSGALDYAGNAGSASATYNVIYSWNGFFRPIDNPGAGPAPIFNVLKAGQAVPIKFSLDGNYGLGIILSAVSIPVSCDTAGTYSTDTAIVAAGGSSLSYDVLADQYNYVWKTDKIWAPSCRMLTVTLNDGTPHVAYFKLLK